jgi:hypothetical protein
MLKKSTKLLLAKASSKLIEINKEMDYEKVICDFNVGWDDVS